MPRIELWTTVLAGIGGGLAGVLWTSLLASTRLTRGMVLQPRPEDTAARLLTGSALRAAAGALLGFLFWLGWGLIALVDLHWFAIGLVYGAAIVGLTFLVRALILPLSIKQIRSMRALSALQPQIKAIQARYKDDRERMQREMMLMYQENNVNPLASCLPLLLQMPIFISLFYLLRSSTFQDEVRAAGEEAWLFIPDITQKAARPMPRR